MQSLWRWKLLMFALALEWCTVLIDSSVVLYTYVEGLSKVR